MPAKTSGFRRRPERDREPTAVGYVAIARRDAGYSDPPGLIDHAPDVVGVNAGDRPVCPALREAALGLFGFPITMVAQAQKPSGLKPVPRLRPGVLGDVGAHAGAERISQPGVHHFRLRFRGKLTTFSGSGATMPATCVAQRSSAS